MFDVDESSDDEDEGTDSPSTLLLLEGNSRPNQLMVPCFKSIEQKAARRKQFKEKRRAHYDEFVRVREMKNQLEDE